MTHASTMQPFGLFAREFRRALRTFGGRRHAGPESGHPAADLRGWSDHMLRDVGLSRADVSRPEPRGDDDPWLLIRRR